MCGLVGFLGGVAGQSCDEALLRRMSDTLVHRGPDDGGIWCDSEPRIGLGHRRLAIVDLSPAGHQPMVSASERYVIAFNGEIYNHLALRSELEGMDCRASLAMTKLGAGIRIPRLCWPGLRLGALKLRSKNQSACLPSPYGIGKLAR